MPKLKEYIPIYQLYKRLFGGKGGSNLRDKVFGTQDQFKQVPALTPEQQSHLKSIFSQLQGGQTGANYQAGQDYISKLLSGDPSSLSEFEAPYRQEFESKTLPGIAERFAGAGPMSGALSSSGFGQALGGAGAQLESQLAGLHANLRGGAAENAIGQYNQLSNQGLGTSAYDTLFQPGKSGLLMQAIMALLGNIGKFI